MDLPTLVKIKAQFFDRAAVLDKLDPAVKRALSKFGAFVRQRARTSIRTRKGTSPPGSPPASHTGALKRGILFGYDPAAKSVVIGPVLAGRMTGAPETLEGGGSFKGRRYAARPYMGPAFAAELDKVGNDFRNLIR